MKYTNYILSIIVLLAIFGCGGSGNNDNSQAANNAGALVGYTLNVVATDTFQLGQVVNAHAYITNGYPTAQTEPDTIMVWYLDIKDTNGVLVYSEHRAGTITGNIVVNPGQQLDLGQHSWDQKNNSGVQVQTGTYWINAVTNKGTIVKVIYIGNGNT